MKQPTTEDFKAHALLVLQRHRGSTELERTAAAIKFGYQLALHHASGELEIAVRELQAFRNKNNSPQ